MHTSYSQEDDASISGRGAPQSVGRIIAILETLAPAGVEYSLAELAVKTGAPKTSLVGLLSGLVAEGCVVRAATGRYALGPRFLSVAARATSGRALIATVRPVLSELAEKTGETALLGALVPDADVACYLDKVESTNPIRYAVNVGERRELYCTVAGKALLAYFEPDRMEAYLQSTPRKKFSATTITSKRALRAEMSRIRAEGLARSVDERVIGASGVSAPIFMSDGSVVAIVMVAGPSHRVGANAAVNEAAVRHAGAECSRLLGGRPLGASDPGHRRV